MNSQPRVIRAVLGLALLTCCGAIGFVLLEDLSFADAIYLAVVTISTVGYGDLAPQTLPGRMFAALLIAGGVGSALYLLSLVAGDVLEGRLRDFYHRSSMMKEISRFRHHVIVCGCGRFGRVVVEELKRVGREIVVVDTDPDLIPDLEALGVDYLIGSAEEDDVLVSAGIRQADSIVLAISGEAVGVFVALSARELNPEIRIHARGESEASVRRLRRAGADFVTSPYQMGGQRTAASILRPSVVDFLDLALPNSEEEIDLEEVRVGAGSELVGMTISEIESSEARLRIIALNRADARTELVPAPDLKVGVTDHLVVIGERTQLLVLARRAQGADS